MALFALSYLFKLGVVGIIVNVVLDVIVLYGTHYVFQNFDTIMGNPQTTQKTEQKDPEAAVEDSRAMSM
jgi:hypothetical protein